MAQQLIEVPEKVARQLVAIDEEQKRLNQRSKDIVDTARVLLGAPDGAMLMMREDGVVCFVFDDGVDEGVDEGDVSASGDAVE